MIEYKPSPARAANFQRRAREARARGRLNQAAYFLGCRDRAAGVERDTQGAAFGPYYDEGYDDEGVTG